MIAIYGLFDPRDGQLRYIGKSVNLKERMARHIRKARSGCVRHSRRWIAGLMASGVTPEVFVFERAACSAEANEAERFWIASMRLAGCSLTNLTLGGDGQSPGYQPSPGARLKQSAAERARGGWSPQHRAAHAAALVSPEVRAKMSAAHKGKAPPRWIIEMAAKAKLGKKRSPETMQKCWDARRARDAERKAAKCSPTA